MIRINTLNRCGETLTIELMGYINKTEFDILYDCLTIACRGGGNGGLHRGQRSAEPQSIAGARRDPFGTTGPDVALPATRSFSIQMALESWGLEAWIDD